MKWQQRQCGDNAWRMRDCFNHLLKKNATHNETFATLASLKKDWEEQLRIIVDAEIATLSKCYEAIQPKLLALKPLSFADRVLESTRLHAHVFESCYSFRNRSPVARWSLLEDATFLFRSIYVDQLYHYFSRFPSSRFQIWSSEEFSRRPKGYLTQMVHWLGLDTKEVNATVVDGNHHVRDYVSTIPPDVRNKVLGFLKDHNERLFEYLTVLGFKQSVRMLKRHFVTE